MADNVVINTGTAATIGADDIAGTQYQRIKVIVGSDGTNLGDVDVTNPLPISGTVSVSGAVQVSGTVTVGGTVTVATGTFSVKDIVPVTTQASVSVSGVPVWMNPTQAVVVNTIAAGFSVNALVTGAVSISAMPAVSISVSAVLGTIITQLGTQVVTVVPGLSVSAVVSGTVTAVLPGSTTGSSGMSGVLVWLGASQSVLISTQVSGTVSVSGTALVSVVAGFSGTALVSGTVSVSGLSVTAAGPSVAATGIVVWIAGGQSSTAVPVVITGTVTAGAGTTVVSLTGSALVSGTVTVSGMLITTTGVTTGTAQAVWIMNPTTVTVTIAGTTTGTVSLLSIVPVTTQTSVSVSGIPVWFEDGALVAVSGVVPVTTQASVSVSGIPVWFSPGAIVANSGLLFTTGLATVASTGQIVIPKDFYRQPVMIVVTSTAVAVSANKYAYTIWTGATGAPAAAGTTSWAVPAGKVLRLNNIQIAMTSSAVLGGSIQVFVGVGATGSMISASISTQLQLLKIQVFGAAALVSAAMNQAEADVAAGESIAVFIAASTAAIARDCVITGNLF